MQGSGIYAIMIPLWKLKPILCLLQNLPRRRSQRYLCLLNCRLQNCGHGGCSSQA